MLYYYALLEELPTAQPTPPGPSSPPIPSGYPGVHQQGAGGWFKEWNKRRRIPVEQLREILKAQGSPWAKELEEPYAAVEKRVPEVKKTHRKALETVLTHVSQVVRQPPPAFDWAGLIESLNAVAEAHRATMARKHAERVAEIIRLAYQAEQDDEEAILVLLHG